MPDALHIGALSAPFEEESALGLRFGSPLGMRMKAVAMILRAHGITPTAGEALYGASDGDPLLALALQHLERHGLAPRRIEITPGELGHLRLPTLVQLGSGALVPVLRVTRRRIVIWRDDGAKIAIARRRFARCMTGFALDLCPALPAHGAFLRRVLGLLRLHRASLWRIGVLGLFATGLSLLAPIVSQLVMDRALPNSDSGLLAAAVLGTLGIGIHQSWLDWLRSRVAIALGADVDLAVQQKLFELNLRMPFAQAERRNVGAGLAVLSAGSSLSELCLVGVLMPLIEFGRALAYLGVLAYTLPALAALSCCAVALCAALMLSVGRRMLLLEREALRVGARQRSRLLEILTGITTIKALGAERRSIKLWLPDFSRQRRIAIGRDKTEVWLRFWLGLNEKAVFVGLIGFGGAACLRGELSLGAFLSSSMLATGFIHGCGSVLAHMMPLFSASVAVRAVDDLIALGTARPSFAAREEPVSDGPGAIEDAVVLRDVWFRYADDGPWILRNFNLRIPVGAQFPLRGASGSGKTTILRLIAGLLEPTRGTVRVFGRNPMLAPGMLGYLPQEPLLFSGSVLSNLRILSGADDMRLAEAAQLTGLLDLVESLPMKLETMMTVGGTNLSGGQRQLVLLTAAVASRHRLLLLDESLAHLDRMTRGELAARGLFSGRTIVSVVHDA